MTTAVNGTTFSIDFTVSPDAAPEVVNALIGMSKLEWSSQDEAVKVALDLKALFPTSLLDWDVIPNGPALTFYACSYGPRYGDPTATFVSLKRGAAEEAAEKAAEFDRKELPSYCDDAFCAGDCALCQPDLCIYGESEFTSARHLFSAAELKIHRHDLRQRKTVVLSP